MSNQREHAVEGVRRARPFADPLARMFCHLIMHKQKPFVCAPAGPLNRRRRIYMYAIMCHHTAARRFHANPAAAAAAAAKPSSSSPLPRRPHSHTLLSTISRYSKTHPTKTAEFPGGKPRAERERGMMVTSAERDHHRGT